MRAQYLARIQAIVCAALTMFGAFLCENRASAGTIYNAATDFDAGWNSGNNPNGVWSYGWSSTLTSSLNLYARNRLLPTYPDFKAWDDPNNNVQFTPLVYKNDGSAYNDGNINIPAGALILHGGGSSGTDFSHVVWTAPSSGDYSLSATFTLQQVIAQANVYVLDNGVTKASASISGDGDSFSYSTVLGLAAGDKIDFAVGLNQFGGNRDCSKDTGLSHHAALALCRILVV